MRKIDSDKGYFVVHVRVPYPIGELESEVDSLFSKYQNSHIKHYNYIVENDKHIVVEQASIY